MSDAIEVALEARNIANWDAHESQRTLFARLVYALEDVDAIAQVNAMNVSDYMTANAELDEADWKIAQIRDALTWINSPEFILNGIKAILKEDAHD